MAPVDTHPSARRPAHVLVIEDDDSVRDVVRRYLERDGHRVSTARDGEAGLLLAAADPPDLVVLDLMLPGIEGLEVCARLRAEARTGPPVAVVMLTALGEEEDRLTGLSLGADDYVTKPFSPRELALRVSSVLRRLQPREDGARKPSLLRDTGLLMDTAARSARLNDRDLGLTVREFDLLAFLLTHPGQVFTRADLLEQVWGWSFGDYSTVTVHVKRLRAKLDIDDSADRIATVYGVGYRYDSEEAR